MFLAVNISQQTACGAIGRVTRLTVRHLLLGLLGLVHFPGAPEIIRLLRVTGFTHACIKSPGPGGDYADIYENFKAVACINYQVGSPAYRK